MKIVVDIHPEIPDTILFKEWPYSYKDLIVSIPGTHYITKRREFVMPLTWEGCLYLDGTFDLGNTLVMGEALMAWVTSKSAEVFLLKSERIATDHPVETPEDSKLYPHQRADVRYLAHARRAILANGLGSGKTFSAVAALKYMYTQNSEDVLPVLVVSPNGVKQDWKRTFNALWPELKVEVLSGTANARKKVFQYFDGDENEPCPFHNLDDGRKRRAVVKVCTCKKDVLIINYESLRVHSRIQGYGNIALTKCEKHGGVDPKITPAKCQMHEKELNNIQFGAVVGDELHRIKSASALQTRAFKAATADADIRIGLTGTPIAGTPDDLWSLLNWLNPDAYPSKVKYIDMLMDVSYNAWGALNVVGVKENKKGLFYRLIDPILRRMPNEIILPNLPPVIYQKREYEMSPKQAKAYNQMRDQMVAQLDDGLLKTDSKLVQMTRLLEFALAYAELEFEVRIDPETGEPRQHAKTVLTDPSGVLDAFIDDLPDYAGEPVVVFSSSKKLLNLLSKRFDKLGVRYGRLTGDEGENERQDTQDKFQEGKMPFILCTPGVGSTGVNLNRARIAVYLGRPWSNIENEQSEGRVRRIGSEMFDSILYVDYVCKGTVQEAVFESLTNKNVNLQEILRDEETFRKVVENGNVSQ